MPGEQARLIVVDDNEMNRDLLGRRLQREGYAVAIAEDGYKALALIKNGRFDLVLLDVMMPGISGIELLSLIRQIHSLADLPVIITTAKDQSDDVVEALQLGANDYVTKPIDLPVLLARIQTHLKLKRLSQLKDEFLRIASHDLKNPLSAVLMSGHLLQQAVPPGTMMEARYYQMVGYIVKHSEDMQRIIRDFLDFQAAEDGNLALARAALQLNDLARDVLAENAQYAASKSIALTCDLDDALPVVNADTARVRQVAQNLIGNAIKFCPGGASVLIRTHFAQGAAVFEVRDSWPGLTDADMEHAFTKYARLSNKPTGEEKSSGLGLAICKQMIELHGGQIGVYNNPDRGATFWFNLPVREIAAVKS
ncbi:MAG: hybrid sensor histidine kinase/response regulator [Aggregatilineales bacterium]